MEKDLKQARDLACDNIGKLDNLSFEMWEQIGYIEDALTCPAGEITVDRLMRVGVCLEAMKDRLQDAEVSDEAKGFRKEHR